MAEVETVGGLQNMRLVPFSLLIDWLMADYHHNPTQQRFNTLKALYTHQGTEIEVLQNLHNFNKGNKSKLKGSDREKQIQLAYQLRYGGDIE